MLTFLPLEQINEMDTWEGSRLNEAKDILAYELTKLVHGEEEAEKARAASRALFGGASADVPTEYIGVEELRDGTIDILTLLVKAGLVPSRSEARRAVEQGGVTADGEKVPTIGHTFSEAQLREGILLRRGKKTFKKIAIQ